MKKKFKFTNASIKARPANPKDAKCTDLEVSDTEIIGLKCLSGKNGSRRFLLRYKHLNRKCSIALVCLFLICCIHSIKLLSTCAG